MLFIPQIVSPNPLFQFPCNCSFLYTNGFQVKHMYFSVSWPECFPWDYKSWLSPSTSQPQNIRCKVTKKNLNQWRTENSDKHSSFLILCWTILSYIIPQRFPERSKPQLSIAVTSIPLMHIKIIKFPISLLHSYTVFPEITSPINSYTQILVSGFCKKSNQHVLWFKTTRSHSPRSLRHWLGQTGNLNKGETGVNTWKKFKSLSSDTNVCTSFRNNVVLNLLSWQRVSTRNVNLIFPT